MLHAGLKTLPLDRYKMTKKPIPRSVQNLRRIWKEKKLSFKINQTEAAAQLGWTQGAFSQYLNDITELGEDAVAKLANFLEVDPCEIDPNYNPTGAKYLRVPLQFSHPYKASPYEEVLYRRRSILSVIGKNNKSLCGLKLKEDLAPIGFAGAIVLCVNLKICPNPDLTKDRKPQHLICKFKKSNELDIMPFKELDRIKSKTDIVLLPLITYLIN
jgi:transcriptional regulator with XRE-family HTH domain